MEFKNMKRISLFNLLLLFSVMSFAQDVTKFLGIPVDGFKSEMHSKLIAKGFTYIRKDDCFKGEFNGKNVTLYVGTNNNKVYRIMIVDEIFSDETDIKIRFNHLCDQFDRNKKYVNFLEKDYSIPEDEDVSYEMMVNKKRYEAAYNQIPDSSKYNEKIIRERTSERIEELLTLKDLKENEKVDVGKKFLYIENLASNVVWFMIDKKYSMYRILMFYDNNYNKADGEDL